MIMEQVPVCDVCHKRRRKTTRYRVYRLTDSGAVGASRLVDLCGEHAPVLETFLGRPSKRGLSFADRKFSNPTALKRAKAPGKE